MLIGVVVDAERRLVFLPPTPATISLGQWLLVAPAAKRLMQPYAIDLDAIEGMTRQAGKRLFLHGDFESVDLNFSSKLKRDECIHLIRSARRQAVQGEDEFEGAGGDGEEGEVLLGAARSARPQATDAAGGFGVAATVLGLALLGGAAASWLATGEERAPAKPASPPMAAPRAEPAVAQAPAPRSSDVAPPAAAAPLPAASAEPVPMVDQALMAKAEACVAAPECLEVAMQAAAASQKPAVKSAIARLASMPPPAAGDRVRSEELLRRGLEALKVGLTQDAHKLFEQARDADPTHAPALAELGASHLLYERAGDARAAYLEALALAPTCGRCWLGLAGALDQERQPQHAAAALLVPLALVGDDRAALLAHYQLQSGAARSPTLREAYATALKIGEGLR
ncbi:hypothetical protein GHT07_20610 [Caenimonas koreensis DSM 17982]|uniref:Tetratricopeptide repeat-containing protein n=1 Tax=Caenimonas koreensis DSM 17982 TaxID=1121255 RepID=A0A844BD99_9BURK|nr:hypothetical protein [Caenimonas koreensis]MRD49679.1 hypothetical protein [Caenimonas koreensis DSM 17982]